MFLLFNSAEIASSSDVVQVEVSNLEHIETTLDHVSYSLDSLLQFFSEWDLIDILNTHSNDLLFYISLFGVLTVAVLLFSHVLKR